MKKVLIIIIILLITSTFYSCKCKKSVINNTSIDTIKVEKIITVTPKRLNTLIIDSPCDSLGNLRPFNYTLGTGKDKLIVKAIHNKLYVYQNLDSIKQVWEKSAKISIKDKLEIRIKEVIPAWVWKYIVISLIIKLLLLTFILRKQIPFLKWIP